MVPLGQKDVVVRRPPNALCVRPKLNVIADPLRSGISPSRAEGLTDFTAGSNRNDSKPSSALIVVLENDVLRGDLVVTRSKVDDLRGINQAFEAAAK